MSLLVEYSVADGKADDQTDAMKTLIEGLTALGDNSFSYTAYSTDSPNRFFAVFEFEDDAAKQRFLDSDAFAAYRDSAGPRFTAPPATTEISRIASTTG